MLKVKQEKAVCLIYIKKGQIAPFINRDKEVLFSQIECF